MNTKTRRTGSCARIRGWPTPDVTTSQGESLEELQSMLRVEGEVGVSSVKRKGGLELDTG